MSIDTTPVGWIKSALYFIAMAVGMAIDYIEVEEVLIYTFAGVMVADWFTGIIKARRLKHIVSSDRSKKGVVEKIAILIIPISIAVVYKALGIPAIEVIMRAAFSLLTVSELFSLIGNCYCIYTKTDIKEFDATTAVIRFLREGVLKILKNLLTHKKPENQQNNEDL